MIKVRRTRGSTNGYFENLRLLLSAICLRRNRRVMPMQEQHLTENHRLAFEPLEQQQYQALAHACKRAILIGNKGDSINSKAHTAVMQALLRLRIFCNNGETNRVLPSSDVANVPSPRHSDEHLSRLHQSGEAACADCSVDILTIGSLSDPTSGYLTQCGRLVCDECKQQLKTELSRDLGHVYTCKFCNLAHSEASEDGDNMNQGQSAQGDSQFPSKIRCLIDDIQTHYQGSKWSVEATSLRQGRTNFS